MSTISTLPNNGTAGKASLFLQKLSAIEQFHIGWFKSRPAIFDSQEYDSISNHTFIEVDGELVNFNFWKYSELPANIKNECLLAYNEVFGYKLSA